MSKAKDIKLDQIRIDGGTQTRVRLNEDAVADYAEIYKDGKDLSPVSVTFDGTDYWLYDGFHRYHARNRAGLATIPADVVNGTQRDAVLLACGANAEHGLKRSNEDKRKSVETLLSDQEWSKKSDRWIAEQCRVSHTFVAKARTDSVGNVANRTVKTRDGKRRTVRKKPTPKTSTPEPEPSPQQQVAAFFDGKQDAPKQYKDKFDVEEIEGWAPKTVLQDEIGRTVPDALRESFERSPEIKACASNLDKVKKTVTELADMPGGQFIDVADITDSLKVLKGKISHSRYWSECPRCKGKINPNCVRCNGAGFLPFSKRGQLSTEEKDYLGVEQ